MEYGSNARSTMNISFKMNGWIRSVMLQHEWIHGWKKLTDITHFNSFLHSHLSLVWIEIYFLMIQFPDPHFKSKHRKRRVVNTDLVSCIAKFTSQIGSRVFLQSDIEELQCDMVDHFEKSGYFDPVEGYDSAKLGENVREIDMHDITLLIKWFSIQTVC
mmetsp:Transcript_17165/g.23599  ORF Transcript_17165/g.23599 Transcript_17165/m.23599 type:complete len:159 (+) Transcript_17165:365-841(+)